jgi:hypothetical protein
VQEEQIDISRVSFTSLNTYWAVTWKRRNKGSIKAPIGPLRSKKQNMKGKEKIEQKVS